MPNRRALLPLLFAFAFIALPAAAQQVIDTVSVGNTPSAVAADSVTNKIYVANTWSCDPNNPPCSSAGTVTVINGANNSTATVNVGVAPISIAVNPVTNQIYVVNECGNDLNCASVGTVTIIDGASNNTTTVNVGAYPYNVVLNSVTNQIYVTNDCGNDLTCFSNGTVTVIDGNTDLTSTVAVGAYPVSAAVDTVLNQIYVVNNCGEDLSCNSPGTVIDIDGASLLTSEVQVGFSPVTVGVNNVTSLVYAVNNYCPDVNNPCPSVGTVTIIDEFTLLTDTVDTDVSPYSVGVDAVTNQIYVLNECGGDLSCGSGGTATIIDGATENTSEINVGSAPYDIGVNPVFNQVYIANFCGDDPSCGTNAGTVSVVDERSQLVTTVDVGSAPDAVAVNATTNRIYIANNFDDSVSVMAGAGAPAALQFVSLTPCRLVDTRQEGDGTGIQQNTSEDFYLPGNCGLPANAAAYSLNVTAVPGGRLGFLSIWPTGQDRPVTSTMNSLDGRIKANAAIVPAGYAGAVSVFVNNTSNVLLDINGYFIPAGDSTLAFYPLTPCRILDTRNSGGPLNQDQERDFPILDSSCIPPGVVPQAYSFNVTAVPNPAGQRLGFLTVWPAGDPRPGVSTLNNLTGTIVANAAVVPAGNGGEVAVYANNTTDLLIDINGYFAAPGTGGLSLYTQPPCRVLDTRSSGGQFVDELVVNVVHSVCNPPAGAQAYVFNATVVPPGELGFLTLWPNGTQRPTASNLNAKDGAITSNMAIVPTSNGLIDAYANDPTQLILDISSYFAP